MFSSIDPQSGQATVEAAFLLPLIFLVIGIVIQPAILLYDRCVMEISAAEGCRAFATSYGDQNLYVGYVERRLGAIPAVSVFHDGDWDISFAEGEAAEVSVTIVNRARLLPLFGVAAAFVGKTDTEDRIIQTVRVTSSLLPAWSAAAEGGPREWVGRWK